MRKYSTLMIFLFLVAIWAAFFASIKFFIWWDLSSTLAPDLQTIAGYLSLGWVFAYLIGWTLASTFLKKYLMFVISLLSLLFICYGYIYSFESSFVLALIISIVGFLYGLWNVVKNVIIAIEITKTGLAETVVNALAWIIFVIFIIIGSILGNVLFESMGHEWYLVIISMLAITAVVSLFLNYDEIWFRDLIKNGVKAYLFERKQSLKESFNAFIPDLKYIIKHYFMIIIASSFLWAISTIVSQSSVEYSVGKFQIDASTASYLLLYSAVWAIIGNIASMKMNKERWKFFIVFNSIFAVVICMFPFVAVTFNSLAVMAVVLGAFFGISSNLIDSYLLKRIGEENKKEYGASTYGLVISIVIFILMFVSSAILKIYGYTILMLLLWFIVLITWILLYLRQAK